MSADRQALEVEVGELYREARADGSTSTERRSLVAERLSELRQLYKRNPSAFSTEVLGMLREIAGAVAVTGRSSRPAAAQPPEEVLKDVFGYDSFRPGQREIIDAVLAGRDPKLSDLHERAVHRFAAAVVADARLSDAEFAEIEQAIGRDGVAEVLVLIGYYTSVALGMKVHKVPIPP